MVENSGLDRFNSWKFSSHRNFKMILILQFNKYAFLIATILSINPIAWIINGIYLKNRWNHPKVNNENLEENTGESSA